MNMYNTLKTYEHSNASIGNNITKSRALRVTMYPASGAFPSAWEFTLIIVVALLAVSFILSGMCHKQTKPSERSIVAQLLYLHSVSPLASLASTPQTAYYA